ATLKRAIGFGTGEYTFRDGSGRVHVLDAIAAIDFDGDGQPDDPTTTATVTGPASALFPLAQSTHLRTSVLEGPPGPGPLDLAAVNRMLANPVVPQRAKTHTGPRR
ncbi:MAG: hypothetical protein AABZ30_13980, partial [Myxococcota bacterium]